MEKRNALISLLNVFLEDINKFNENIGVMSPKKFNELKKVLDENIIDTSVQNSNGLRFNDSDEKRMVREIIEDLKNGKFDDKIKLYMWKYQSTDWYYSFIDVVKERTLS